MKESWFKAFAGGPGHCLEAIKAIRALTTALYLSGLNTKAA
jgi:hypothetical protein